MIYIKMVDKVIIFCAHSDDEVLAAGGTIAKYTQEGKEVIIVIFSYGEASNPIVQDQVIINERIKEADKIGEFLGIKEVIFLGIVDGRIYEKINDRKFLGRISDIIKKYEPKKIFTHAGNDPHRDHRSVNKIVVKVIDSMKEKYDVFTFDVWNIINVFRKTKPELYVDTSDTFDKKLNALKLFESQQVYVNALLPSILFNAKLNGSKINCKYAERFLKVR